MSIPLLAFGMTNLEGGSGVCGVVPYSPTILNPCAGYAFSAALGYSKNQRVIGVISKSWL